jgi:hypothetical protein
MGYYRRVQDSSGAQGQFDLQSSVGIAIGRSNHTNGMIFWDLVTQRMNVSADYHLDTDAAMRVGFLKSYEYFSKLEYVRYGLNSTLI